MFAAKRRMAGLSAMAMGLALSTQVMAAEPQVQYIMLTVNGNYVVSDVWVKWKNENGKVKSRKFTGSIAKEGGFCADLSKIGPGEDNVIIEGKEVWVEAQIALGDKVSCRKDNKHVYSKNNTVWYLKMGGNTLTENRCSNSDWFTEALTIDLGNSKDCYQN